MKKLPLSDKEKFCLDAYLRNGNAPLAYQLSRDREIKTDRPEIIAKMASRWMNDDRVKAYINQCQQADFKAVSEDENAPTNRSRSDTVTELNALINSVSDPRIRGDLLLKLADLNRWKQQEQNEQDLVHFYIPLRVNDCIALFAYQLQKEFGWGDDEAKRAEEIMRAGYTPNVSN